MPSNNNDSLQVAKLNSLTSYLRRQHALKLELYERGGQHPKDLEGAYIYAKTVEMLETLFPELTEVK